MWLKSAKVIETWWHWQCKEIQEKQIWYEVDQQSEEVLKQISQHFILYNLETFLVI